MLSLKSQISVLDNFVIREESISPVLAMMSKDNVEHSQILSDGSVKDVRKIIKFVVCSVLKFSYLIRSLNMLNRHKKPPTARET